MFKLENYTEKERLEFIVQYNHNCGLRIEEYQKPINDTETEENETEENETEEINTSTILYALEAWEQLVDGEVIIGDKEKYLEELAKQQRNREIDSKIQELQIMALPEVLNGNIENIKLYNEVIDGLEKARP